MIGSIDSMDELWVDSLEKKLLIFGSAGGSLRAGKLMVSVRGRLGGDVRVGELGWEVGGVERGDDMLLDSIESN